MIQDLFDEIAAIGARYGIKIARVNDQPVIRVGGLPFLNPNTASASFIAGYVQDSEVVWGFMPGAWFFDSPTNDMDKRLRDWVKVNHAERAA